MTLPDRAALEAALEATWPPAESWTSGPWRFRRGAEGGKRVSAATALAPVDAEDISRAEAEMKRLGQWRLFRAEDPTGHLSRRLEDRGYILTDISTFYAAPCTSLLKPDQPPLDAVTSETLLGIQAELWAAGGIGPGRLAVMDRATHPKAWLLARLKDRAAGAGFVSIFDGIAMVHALETKPEIRRMGAGRAMLHRAARWAQERGARTIALAVTAANGPANALYSSLGMTPVGQYHYRIHPEDG